jgi:hypothetical protein
MNATRAHKRNTITHDDVEEVDDELEEDSNSRQSCANRVCTAQEEHRANVWLRVMTVEANATSVVEGRGRSVTTRGDNAYDITHKASWRHSRGHHTRYEAKAVAATEGRRDRMQRRGRNQMIVRRSVCRRCAARQRTSVCRRQTLSISRRSGVVVTWLRREKRGHRLPESPISSFYKVAANAQRITEGLPATAMSLSLLLGLHARWRGTLWTQWL